jgi:hypothetical protein
MPKTVLIMTTIGLISAAVLGHEAIGWIPVGALLQGKDWSDSQQL